MRAGGGGRGGGGGRQQQPRAAAAAAGEGAEIPPASRKLVQGLKGILADRTEAEIYATLLDCGMDPDVAVERLISQDPFHEVRRKRNNKKEVKAPQEARSRPFYKSTYRGSKAVSDRSGRSYSGLGDSTGSVKGTSKKEAGLIPPENLSASDSVKASNPTETVSAAGNLADAKPSTFQPPSQAQHGWGGVPGRPSMADIVKMGRPQAKSGSRSAGISAGVPTVAGSVVSNASNPIPKDSHNTVLPSEGDHVTANKLPNGTVQVHSVPADDSFVDILPPGEGSDVPESFGAVSTNAKPAGSIIPEVNEVDFGNDDNFEETKEMSASNASGLTSSGPLSVSDKDVPSSNDLIEKSDNCQSDKDALEHRQDSNDNMSTTSYLLEHLTIHEEKRPKASEDNPAVIIPGHLQVSNADFADLTFGSFVSGTLDVSCSTVPANSDGEVTSVSENHSSDQSDVRIHEYENKEAVIPAANEYIAPATNSNMENTSINSVQQSEVGRAGLMGVTNSAEYNLSPTDYATSSTVQPDSAPQNYLQENRQMQNISPLSSFMQGNIPNGLLPPAMPPFRELDPAFSLLLTNPPLATMIHGTPPSSMSNTTVSTQPQENVNPGGLSNTQLTHSQASTSMAPLPHHLALHPYAQATLPLGYTSMMGYPSLPQSYYLPPAAFQQPYMNSGLFHQAAAAAAAAAAPNSNVKYPMPQYKSNVPLASMPQQASLLSNYVGGFGTANGMPGNYALNQSSVPANAAPGFDGTMPSQYKDGNHYISLQQNENPAMWMHGAGSRGMPPLAANTLYGYQGQQGHQGGLRQGQLPSQFGAALGQSQQGLGQEHRNPSDSNLSAAGQANQMWPNSY
ncbi:uncharacterized protein LOC100825596 isoform X2 [Brachypodium distachyon]|uniref:GBF-interacting protein 1 N-terminal domain-containing protein n=1 Tax=Brachypodium distachyon TaxID=15368 RepID=A0A0Q3MK24_BRADI|nr:uncharacterized protein LOC100825596 isoform X2 [Brachypodium distachyon]KQK04686.1 hypothetical protein BRADI_2g15260v3 [Brachypodium distachyon]|eukprot:XP_003567822.2 uncharacterized protein LOC100825596 isoform X2 [Brachypodium distachyon]